MKKTIWLFFLSMLLILLVSIEADAQCAMCGASVQSASEGAEVAAGLNAGILYLLAIPYLIFMSFAVVIYRSLKRQKNENKKVFHQN